MSGLPIQCLACVRLNRTPRLEALDGARSEQTVTEVSDSTGTCTAYPAGIPEEIGFGADHRQPFGGERDGLLFLQAGTPAAREAFDAWKRTFG